MAVWQYSCSLIPRASITIQTIEDQIRVIFWAEFEQDDSVIRFGSYDGNICSVYTKNNTISSFSCRLDMRTIDKETLKKVYEFAQVNNLTIIDLAQEKELVSKGDFLWAIRGCSWLRFVQDPRWFFESL